MYTLKRITARLLVLFILLGTIPWINPNNSFATDYATMVKQVSVEGNIEIYPGDEFTLHINLDGSAQRVVIDGLGNFKMSDSSNSYGNAYGATTWKFKMTSLGKGDTLSMKVIPVSGDESGSFTTTVTVPNVAKAGSENVATDSFKVSTSKAREVVAGSNTNLSVPFETLNNTFIEKVTATIISPKDETLFKSENTEYTSVITAVKKDETYYTNFEVEINPLAKAKTYEVKLQFKYTTATGITFIDETNNSYFIKVKNGNTEPNLSVVNNSLSDEGLNANEKATLNLEIENSGTATANDIRVKLSGLDKDHIRLASDSDTKSISSLTGRAKGNVSYKVSASPTAKTDSNELAAEISYIDDNGKEYKTTSKVYIQVTGNDASSIELKVLNLKMPSEVKAKGAYSMEFDVKNVSKTEAKLVEVGIEYPNTTVVPKSTPKKMIKSIKPGVQQHFKFDFIAKEDAVSGFYDHYIALKYNVEGGKDTDAITYKEFAGILVDGAVGLGRPKVIIENYDFGGTTVVSGQEFDLSLDLFNTSSEESIKNIKVSLKADEGVFLPVDMSSSFFIESIGSQAHVNKTIKLRTKNDAAVKAYNIIVTFQYEDSKGNAYDSQKNPFKEEESIAIPVNQAIRIETGEITLNPENYVGVPSPVSLEFFNLGKSTVSNLMVKVEGDFDIQGGSYFVGNFEPGRNDFFEAQISPRVEGENKGKITFLFEDANGQPGMYEKEFTMMVTTAPVDPNAGGENPDGNGGDPENPGVVPMEGPKAKMIIAGILAGICAAFGGVLIYKRKMERKIALKNMEDADE